jgi:hypothetical protein
MSTVEIGALLLRLHEELGIPMTDGVLNEESLLWYGAQLALEARQWALECRMRAGFIGGTSVVPFTNEEFSRWLQHLE